MKNVTTKELKTLLDGTTLHTLVDVYADWCAPCKRMMPVLEDMESAFASELNMVKIDADVEHNYSDVMAIRSIPTLIMHNNEGIEVDRWTGNQDPTLIRNWILQAITK